MNYSLLDRGQRVSDCGQCVFDYGRNVGSLGMGKEARGYKAGDLLLVGQENSLRDPECHYLRIYNGVVWLDDGPDLSARLCPG